MRLRDFIDVGLSSDELERLDRVDALLRAAQRPSLRLVPPPPPPAAAAGPTRERRSEHELKLSFRELSLIHQSLQAARTIGVPPRQSELLEDTIDLVDQALKDAI